jgi:hypothetical protein
MDVSMPWSSKSRSGKWVRCVILDKFSSLVLTTGTSRKITTHYFLSFVHLQLVVRGHYYGPGYGMPADSLSYVEVLRPRRGHGTTMLLCAEACVCSQQEDFNRSSLCLRIQQWALIHSPGAHTESISDTIDMNICHHLSTWD